MNIENREIAKQVIKVGFENRLRKINEAYQD